MHPISFQHAAIIQHCRWSHNASSHRHHYIHSRNCNQRHHQGCGQTPKLFRLPSRCNNLVPCQRHGTTHLQWWFLSHLFKSTKHSQWSSVIKQSAIQPQKLPATQPPLYGPVHSTRHIIPKVMSSAAEAEVGTLFYNGQEAVPIRVTIKELQHPKPPMPMKTANSTVSGVAKDTIKKSLQSNWHAFLLYSRPRLPRTLTSLLASWLWKYWRLSHEASLPGPSLTNASCLSIHHQYTTCSTYCEGASNPTIPHVPCDHNSLNPEPLNIPNEVWRTSHPPKWCMTY